MTQQPRNNVINHMKRSLSASFTIFLTKKWRRGRDSNPRTVARQWFSRPPRSTAPAPLPLISASTFSSTLIKSAPFWRTSFLQKTLQLNSNTSVLNFGFRIFSVIRISFRPQAQDHHFRRIDPQVRPPPNAVNST